MFGRLEGRLCRLRLFGRLEGRLCPGRTNLSAPCPARPRPVPPPSCAPPLPDPPVVCPALGLDFSCKITQNISGNIPMVSNQKQTSSRGYVHVLCMFRLAQAGQRRRHRAEQSFLNRSSSFRILPHTSFRIKTVILAV